MIFPFNAGEVFKIALQLEENGGRFYEKAAAGPFPAEIQELFWQLAREEMAHKAAFTHLLAQVSPAAAGSTVWDPDNELDQYLKLVADMHVFSQGQAELDRLMGGLASYPQAVKMAMSFEKDSIIFFLELMHVAGDDQESREQIGKLVDEERRHLRQLAGLLTGRGQ